ncbi:MAG: hypothetical protein SVW57_04385, partial [Thermodesulfobacteriota bacterium]|nr:hypothetical protein [Thermodesulfobacteriota bacterium]
MKKMMVAAIFLVIVLLWQNGWAFETVSIAIIPFKVNSKEDLKTIGAEIAKKIALEMEKTKKITVLWGKRLEERLGMNIEFMKGEEHLRKIANDLSMDYCMGGTITQIGDSFSLDTRLV